MKKVRLLQKMVTCSALLLATSAVVSAAPTTKLTDAQKRDKKIFQAVTSKLDMGGSSFTFNNSETLMKNLLDGAQLFLEMVPTSSIEEKKGVELFAKLIENSGLRELSAYGKSYMKIDADFFTEKSYLYRNVKASKGIFWQVFGQRNVDLNATKSMLPKDTAFATFSTLNIKTVINFLISNTKEIMTPAEKQRLDQTLQMVEMISGKDLNTILDSLKNESTFIMTLNPNIEFDHNQSNYSFSDIYNLSVVLKVKDSTIFEILKRLIPPTKAKQVTKNGRSYIEFPEVKAELKGLKPTICFSGDKLIIGSSPEFCDKICSENSQIQEVRLRTKQLPDNGVSFTFVSENVEKLMNKGFKHFVAGNLQAPEQIISQKIVKDYIFKVPRMASVTQVDQHGYLTTATTDSKSLQIDSSLITSSIIVAAISVPALAENREVAQERTMEANKKMVAAALNSFLADNPAISYSDVKFDDIKASLNVERVSDLNVLGHRAFFTNSKLVYLNETAALSPKKISQSRPLSTQKRVMLANKMMVAAAVNSFLADNPAAEVKDATFIKVKNYLHETKKLSELDVSGYKAVFKNSALIYVDSQGIEVK